MITVIDGGHLHLPLDAEAFRRWWPLVAFALGVAVVVVGGVLFSVGT